MATVGVTTLVTAASAVVVLWLLVLGARLLLGLTLTGLHELKALSILHRRSILQ